MTENHRDFYSSFYKIPFNIKKILKIQQYILL